MTSLRTEVSKGWKTSPVITVVALIFLGVWYTVRAILWIGVFIAFLVGLKYVSLAVGWLWGLI